MVVSFGGGGFGSVEAIAIDEFVYEREASTFVKPVPAGVAGYDLFSWENINYMRRNLLLYAIGTDQHDNSVYNWYIDGVRVPSISGSAQVGSIEEPFHFPSPIRVRKSVALRIDNYNGVAYPNDGVSIADRTPYEVVMIGTWEVV